MICNHSSLGRVVQHRTKHFAVCCAAPFPKVKLKDALLFCLPRSNYIEGQIEPPHHGPAIALAAGSRPSVARGCQIGPGFPPPPYLATLAAARCQIGGAGNRTQSGNPCMMCHSKARLCYGTFLCVIVMSSETFNWIPGCYRRGGGYSGTALYQCLRVPCCVTNAVLCRQCRTAVICHREPLQH